MVDINYARQDRAIRSSDDDDLDRQPFIANLISALVEDIDMTGPAPSRRSTGFVVGLTGEWGLGKSSVLNLLEEQLGGMEQVIVTTFNPWLFKGRDELVQGYFNALRRALGKNKGEHAQQALKALDDYRSSIDKAATKGALILDAHGGGGVASIVWKVCNWILSFFRPAPPKTPDEERTSLEKKLAATHSAIVVLIDELDRVEDEEVRAVAQLVKAVGDIKGISYLVAYDPKRVAEALGRGDGEDRRVSGEAYLEKIVQMPIPLRPLFDDDVVQLLPAALRRYGFDLPEPRSVNPHVHEQAVYNELLRGIKTPREIKRLAGSFVGFERMVRGEICVWDVLGYSWIASKSPSLRDRIADNLNAMISDPSDNEMIRRLALRMEDDRTRRTEKIEDVLGAELSGLKGMLETLFPRFVENSDSPEGNRLARRRNLTRLLYLGNPPGLIPRAEIEETWGLAGDVLRKRLERYRADDKLGVMLDRLDDLLPELSEAGDETFWPVLSEMMVRPVDWAQGRSISRDIIEDAGKTLWRLGSSGNDGRLRVSKSVASLIASGDLLLSPWMLRKHLFGHGMTIHRPSGTGQVIFDREATQAMLDSETPRYRAALMSGYALRRLPDNELMYVLGNSDRIDDDLRNNLTEQLVTLDAIASFAVITVPPGYTTDKRSLDQFIDTDAVLVRLNQLLETEALTGDPYLRTSLSRLRVILGGGDPHFIRDEEM